MGDRERIGIFGGTFDPPHVGHLVVAVNVRHALALDRVLMVVANEPWQKTGTRPITPAVHRHAMVAAATAGVDGIEASDLELQRGGDSYTADTLHTLGNLHPDAAFYVIVGADAAAGLDTWERIDEVRAMSTIVAVERPGAVLDGGAVDGLLRISAPRLEVSSSDLRARVTDGRPLDFLVPPTVIRSIDTLGLYRDGR